MDKTTGEKGITEIKILPHLIFSMLNLCSFIKHPSPPWMMEGQWKFQVVGGGLA